MYTIALMVNALAGMRASASLEGFYVGSRNLSGPLIGLSFFATFASTNSYIGHAGKGYEYGLAWMVMPCMLVVFTYISWRWIGPRTRVLARNFDAMTLPDFLAARFIAMDHNGRHPLRVVSALVVMLCSLLYLVAIFKGAGHLFERFFNVLLRRRDWFGPCRRNDLYINRGICVCRAYGCSAGRTHDGWCGADLLFRYQRGRGNWRHCRSVSYAR